ncbi:MAG TPA: GyrI-like domain-containing protein [Bryobacteraceae bacterium]|nr:GyrI-like domain-containing protein [Bryobacteraceae bacterium]
MKDATANSYQERILRTLVHIQGHLDDALALDDLARIACFSPCHFHRVFRALAGEPVQEHVRRLRLERAAHRLKLQDQPVTGIAFDAGYESHEAFTRAFHSMFGMSPSQFRAARAVENQAAPESPSGTHYNDTSAYHPPDYGSPPAVRVQTLEPQRVVFLRHTGPYDQVGATWGKLAAWAGPRGLFGPSTRFIGISWDDPEITPPDKLRYDAAITVSAPVQPEGEFGVMEIAGGEYATMVHKGPYEAISATYRMIFGAWLPSSGRELRDVPCLEVYLNSPQMTRPEDLLTLIHVPLA